MLYVSAWVYILFTFIGHCQGFRSYHAIVYKIILVINEYFEWEHLSPAVDVFERAVRWNEFELIEFTNPSHGTMNHRDYRTMRLSQIYLRIVAPKLEDILIVECLSFFLISESLVFAFLQFV